MITWTNDELKKIGIAEDRYAASIVSHIATIKLVPRSTNS